MSVIFPDLLIDRMNRMNRMNRMFQDGFRMVQETKIDISA